MPGRCRASEGLNMKAHPPRPVRTLLVGSLNVQIYRTSRDLAVAASEEAAAYLKTMLKAREVATVMLAAGNAHLEFLSHFVRNSDVDWGRVNLFHMDESLALEASHPASLRRHLKEGVE